MNINLLASKVKDIKVMNINLLASKVKVLTDLVLSDLVD